MTVPKVSVALESLAAWERERGERRVVSRRRLLHSVGPPVRVMSQRARLPVLE